jgi:hypothetical protein
MIDYLLKFPSKAIAEQFGIANGFAQVDPKSGKVISSLASHTHALYEIGEHFKPTGKTVTDISGSKSPELVRDGQWWVLFRDLVGIPVPEGGNQFIIWSSDMTITDDAGSEISVPRPEFNPDVPSVFWA